MKIAHVMLLIGSLLVCPAHGQDKDADAREKLARSEILKEHRILDEYGGLRLCRIDNTELPGDVVYPGNTLSLVADPKARGAGSIAVYIINATNQPAPGLDFELTKVWQEVLDGDIWKCTRPFGFDCGTVSPPQDLMAGQTLIKTSADPSIGDLEGDLRYCLEISSGRPIVSQVIRGRFSSKDFEKAGLGQNWLEYSILNDLRGGILGGMWNQCQIASNHDQFATAVELLRCYGEACNLRATLRGWLEKPATSTASSLHEPKGFRERLRKSLASPWRESINEREFFAHCLKLLSSPAEMQARGISEEFHMVIWRCLYGFGERPFNPLVNPERYDQLETYRATGNPWGADTAEMSSIVAMAEADLASKNTLLQNAAGRFLSGKWVTVELFSDARLRGLLENGSPIAKRTALLMLKDRNQRDDAIRWLCDHYKELDSGLIWVWNSLGESNKPLAPWEIPIALHLIEQQPLTAFFWLDSRVERGVKSTRPKLPVELRSAVISYLQKEANERKVVGEKLPPYDQNGMLITSDGASYEPQYLAAGLSILADWEMPEDTGLIHKFLTHPAAGYSRKDKLTETKFYTVREKAVSLLRNRVGTAPPDVVVKEEIRARDLPPP